jgi:putative intracellular protease/amidase
MWKKTLIGVGILAGLGLSLAAAAYGYIRSLDLESVPSADPATTAADIPFIRDGIKQSRGKILAVVTSTPKIGQSDKRAGYELTELSRAYYVFVANGYEVDIASPRGGEAPMTLDDGLVEADYAFLNDPTAQAKVSNTLAIEAVDASQYRAVYFVGGKGAMFDLPDNPHVQRIVKKVYETGVVGAVCHGPAALLNVKSNNGEPFLANRRMTGFTNAEELFLMDNARELFPYLLQDQAGKVGAKFVEAPMYLDNTVVDGRLITGQNPWSTWSVAEAMVQALGHTPIARDVTAEEYSVGLLAIYHTRGLATALDEKARLPRFDKKLILMHALVAAMRARLGEAYALQQLARS